MDKIKKAKEIKMTVPFGSKPLEEFPKSKYMVGKFSKKKLFPAKKGRLG